MEWISAKTILSGYTENNNWFGTNYNMNIYKGCSHGCLYCDSRSDCYRVDDFDRVRAKENALILLEKELKAKRRSGVVGTGAMSDPYNPYEKEHQLTRGALDLIRQQGYGVAIATKSALIVRDIDLLQAISKNAPVLIKMTVTTADDDLCRKIEPNVSLASERLKAIQKLSEAGIFAGVLMMPVLPFIEDTEENIRTIIERAHQSGAQFIYPAFGVTLRQNQRDWFFKELDRAFPGIKEKYIQTFGNAYECRSPNAKALWHRFTQDCDQYGILYKMDDIISAYKKPYKPAQVSFF